MRISRVCRHASVRNDDLNHHPGRHDHGPEQRVFPGPCPRFVLAGPVQELAVQPGGNLRPIVLGQRHGGTIIPDGPNRIWGTDATQVQTRLEGTATVFVAIDHFVGDVVGIHAARPGTRFEALEPIYQGLREHYGPLAQDIAEGLVLRHDHGPQYMSHAFQQEIAFLGIESSPSFIKAPEGNGVAERFIRTLKEQLLWVRTFDTVEELRQALLEFKGRFNKHWLLQRHGYATPNQVRVAHLPVAEVA